MVYFFFFQAEDGIRAKLVTGVQTCALPISRAAARVTAPENSSERALLWSGARRGRGRRSAPRRLPRLSDGGRIGTGARGRAALPRPAPRTRRRLRSRAAVAAASRYQSPRPKRRSSCRHV